MPGADERRPGDTDDTLVLLFLCCHPSLSVASQIALTLRAVGGLSAAEIARALLGSEQTVTRRITRAKQSIKASGIPFALPDADELGGRLDAVLRVLYLIFNEGYASTTGTALVRVDLAEEAIRLARGLRAALDRRQRGSRVARADAPRARSTPGPHGPRRVAHPHGGARPQPVGPGCHRGRDRARHRRPSSRADRAIPAPGGNRRPPRRGREPRSDRLAPDRRPLRRPTSLGRQPGRRAQPRRRRQHGRRAPAGLELVQRLGADSRVNADRRFHAVRGHLLEMAGDRAGAIEAYRAAARAATNLQQQRYLNQQITRLQAP